MTRAGRATRRKRRASHKSDDHALRRERWLFAALAAVGVAGILMMQRCVDRTHSLPPARADSAQRPTPAGGQHQH